MTYELGAPGIRFKHQRIAPAIGPLRTDIALFVGIAERGPVQRPVAVESFVEFQAIFGGFLTYAYLAYAIKAFFDNGGMRTWIVRVASRDGRRGAQAAAGELNAGGVAALEVRASSPGSWGNKLSVSVLPGLRRSAISAANNFDARSARLKTLDGFQRGTHLRLSQPGGFEAIRVASQVDLKAGRIYWVHPEPGHGLDSDAAVAGLDRNRPLTVETLNYSFVVRKRGRVIETHMDCVLVPEHPRFVNRLLRRAGQRRSNQNGHLSDTPVAIQIASRYAGPIPPALDDDPAVATVLSNGQDGLARLAPSDIAGDLSDTTPRGIEAAAEIEEISIIATPDLHIRPALPPLTSPVPPVDPCDPCVETPLAMVHPPPLNDLPPAFSEQDILRTQWAIVAHCERLRNRFAVLDAPLSAARPEAGIGPIATWRRNFDSSFAALYYPWTAVADPLELAPLREIPPSGHVVGQMARLDLEEGVHRPPANVPLLWLQKTNAEVSEAAHSTLNSVEVNVLRPRAGLGPRVVGARTLSSDPHWRFVNTRRLVMMIAKAAELGSRWAVFEPNDRTTRNKLSANLSAFLSTLWQRGALRGVTAGDAFAVRCDEANNPPQERINGRLQIDIALAPVGALEVIVVRLGRVDGALEINEQIGRPVP
jgi:hypothetical protein